ncbi:Proteinase inhibitor I3, Kunitz legume [Sesbania bispinosa]|nr:Proteinase inhibitor I3, Kunitz legume [Sesbania bispinosa]
MKLIFLLTLSFLLFAFTIDLPLAFSQENIEQVKDIDGNPIFPGGRFYIVSAIRGAGGGGVTTLGQTGDSTCPVTVVQERFDVMKGLLVKLKIPGISPGIIFTNITNMDTVFEEKPECVESSRV